MSGPTIAPEVAADLLALAEVLAAQRVTVGGRPPMTLRGSEEFWTYGEVRVDVARGADGSLRLVGARFNGRWMSFTAEEWAQIVEIAALRIGDALRATLGGASITNEAERMVAISEGEIGSEP